MNNESQVLNVPIEEIIPNRFQPRLNFDELGLKELAASIKEHGIIQPLVLRNLGDKYEIIAGERRYKAAKMAGLTKVPAIISLMDDKKSAEVAIVENVQRRDLSSIEEAKSYKALLDKGYLTQEELAKKMGLSQSAISNKLRLLSLSEEVQNALMVGKISERHARSLLQIEDEKEQEEWLNKIINERLTVRELDKRIKNENIKEPIEKKEEVPIIEFAPNIEEIKANATDIIVDNSLKETVTTNPIDTEIKPIPNKFFNYLEDEQANMSMVEPVNNIVMEEEIELLDFLVPDINTENNNLINVDEVDKRIDNTIKELNNLKYEVKLDKDETSNEIKYIICINKNKND